MRRNYTQAKLFLQKARDKRHQLGMISRAYDDRWTDGYSTAELRQQYLDTNRDYHEAAELIKKEIDKVSDPEEAMILTQRFLYDKTGQQIQNIMGGSEKHIRRLFDRALQSIEIILINDGLLPCQDPRADLMKDYHDGYSAGLEEGKAAGYEEGYNRGYRYGYFSGYVDRDGNFAFDDTPESPTPEYEFDGTDKDRTGKDDTNGKEEKEVR